MKQFIIILALFSALLAGCSEQKFEPKKVNIDTREIPAQESWISTIVFTDSGRTKAIIYTNHLRMFTQSQETFLDDSLHVDFFDRFQKRSTTLTAKRGKVDDRLKNLFAYQDVVAKNDSGVTLLTEEVPTILQMTNKTVSFVLGCHGNAANTRIERIGKSEIDNATFTTEVDGRFGPPVRKLLEAATPPSGQNERQDG